MPKYIGLDVLAAPKYPKKVFAYVPTTFALGFFDSVFTKHEQSLKFTREAATLGYPLLKSHIFPEEWRGDHKFVKRSDFKKIGERAKHYEEIALAFPGTEIQLSGCCEHVLNAKDAGELRYVVEAAAPHCSYVNSPAPSMGGAILPGVNNELHTVGGKPPSKLFQISGDGIVNGEGVTSIDADAWLKRWKDAYVLWFWIPLFNMRRDDTTAPPKERTQKPDEKDFKAVIRLTEPRGEEPTFPFPTLKTWPKGWIYKSDSEDKTLKPGEKDDGRRNRPCLIAPTEEGEDVVLKASNGKRLGIFKDFGTFNQQPGFRRAYSGRGGIGLYGYEIEDLAEKASGSRFVALCTSKGNVVVRPSQRWPERKE